MCRIDVCIDVSERKENTLLEQNMHRQIRARGRHDFPSE